MFKKIHVRRDSTKRMKTLDSIFSYLKVSEKDMNNLTDGYNKRNNIDSDASSTMYKGFLLNGMTMSIKKMKVKIQV